MGATLETRCFQDLIFDDFGSILGPPLGPLWDHFGHLFFDAFLKTILVTFWIPFLHRFLDPPKTSKNGGGLEATWEPPLKQGASKTSFLTILAPFWDTLWDQFRLISGIVFSMFF